MQILKEYRDILPVEAVVDKINASLRDHNRLVVTAPPGSGKSTLLPLTIADNLKGGKIVMLEPRRAAARQIATRMAQMLGEKPGQTVGYRMRFESKVSSSTRIEVVTEGVMERMLIDDPTLDSIDVVIFDEFHERSLTADLTLALTLEAQKVIRPDLRIVIMSATMDTDYLCKSLDAKLIEADGRMHDVEIIHLDDFEIRDCARAVASAVGRAWHEQSGNILAFLPGTGDIQTCCDLLTDALADAVILPLHGSLSPAVQYRAIEYTPAHQRKIVLATPIAETSLTIEGIRTIVDSGLYRQVRQDASTGLSRLETARISMDMARQRTGRAGRLAAGVCYRLWSKATEHRMAETRTPEILNSDLGGMALDVAAWGGCNPDKLPWLTPPPSANLRKATALLSLLGAIDDDGKITSLGQKMAALPCNPRIASMLLNAPGRELQSLAADIAALLEEKDPLANSNDADLNSRIALLRDQRRSNRYNWNRIIRIAEHYRTLIQCPENNGPVDPHNTGALLAMAYPERLAMRLNNDIYRLPNGDNVRLDAKDDLSACDWLAVASVDRRIFLASPVGKDTLEHIAHPHLNISWNSREGRIMARDEMRIGVLTVSHRPVENPDRDRVIECISNAALKEGRSMFDFNDTVSVLINRIAIVAEWHPELRIPAITIDSLLESASEWLPLYIGDATTIQGLHKLDIREIIKGMVGYEIMSQIDAIAPEHLQLPSGRNVRIDYRTGSAAPVVSARIQDCFGLHDTPRLDRGKRPVLMELLSPGFKPVQLTQDLQGFWTNTYYEIRKELKRRYPKHRWPDNPEKM